jgi:predicted membrane-bound spermidine synthase
VLNAPSGDDAEAAERPPSQWVLIGALLEVSLFLPSSLLALWLGQRLARSVDGSGAAAALVALPVLLALAGSAWSAAALSARFGIRTRPLHQVSGSVLGSVFILGLSLLGRVPWSFELAAAAGSVVIGVGALAAWLGARYGLRRRP